MAPRRSYTAAFKLAAIEKAASLGNRAAAREYGIDEKCIRRWKVQQEILRKLPRQKRAQRKGTVHWPTLEDDLAKWITEQRERGLPLSTVTVRLQAKKIALQLGLTDFRGGPNWCYRFMRRKHLSVRSRTTVGQKLPSDWEVKKSCFLQYVKEIVKEKNFELSSIVNMDEVPLQFDCPPNRTINEKGEKTISITSTGNERTSFTCVLACASNGDKLKPLLIFKRKTLPPGDFPKDVVICANQKGWMNEEIFIQWLSEVWRKRSKAAFFKPRGLLILDSMRTHIKETVKKESMKQFASLAVIPGGLTKILQPLDLTVNKNFKEEMRKRWEHWMRAGIHTYTKSGTMRKASYEEVAQWVSDSWKAISKDVIISGFRRAEIFSQLPPSAEMPSTVDNESSDDTESEDDTDDQMTDELLRLFQSDTDESDFEGFQAV